MFAYRKDITSIAAEQLEPFYVGWPDPPKLETRLKILQNSDVVILAYRNDQLIGFINAITDKTLCAYIPLLEVLPEYQNLGVGSELIKIMLETLKDFYMVDLICDEKLQSYYEKFNMRKSFGMSIRKYERQSGIN
jgi:ribosomal protein S18 acetylase RimI-like enzyme